MTDVNKKPIDLRSKNGQKTGAPVNGRKVVEPSDADVLFKANDELVVAESRAFRLLHQAKLLEARAYKGVQIAREGASEKLRVMAQKYEVPFGEEAKKSPLENWDFNWDREDPCFVMEIKQPGKA